MTPAGFKEILFEHGASIVDPEVKSWLEFDISLRTFANNVVWTCVNGQPTRAPITTREIPEDITPPYTPLHLLTSLLNNMHRPASAKSPTPTHQPIQHQGLNSCPSAEPNFASTLMRLKNNERTKNTGCNIFVNEIGEPYLLQKCYGEPTALTLGQMNIGKIAIPPGTILSLLTTVEGQSKDMLGRARCVAYPRHKILGAYFMRFSEFAFAASTRHYSQKAWNRNKEGLDLLHKLEPDQLQPFVANAIRKRNIAVRPF